MKIKAVIFDLDGTLIDSMPAWCSIGAEFLKAHRIEPPADLKETLKTMSFAQSAQYFIDDLHVSLSADEIIAVFNSMVEDKYRYTIMLKPFVKQFLEKLKSENVKLCIATATEKSLAEQALKRLNVLHYFDFIVTCNEVGFGKDNTAIYLKAADMLSCAVNETIVFEDALYCINTAKAAGFYVIGVYDSYSDGDYEEIKRTSDRTILTFEEMM